MEIIPAIALQDGRVVRGPEDRRPIASRLAQGDAPDVLAAALCRVVPASRLAVTHRDAAAAAVLPALAAALPAPDLWVEPGLAAADAAAWLAAHPFCLVLASRAQPAAGPRLPADDRVILSLDFRGAAFQGPPELLADVTLWPDRVIVTDLARIATARGPDIAQVARIRTRSARAVFAAGGVRDRADLQALSAAGAAGALVATALHSGAID
jgi:phosphoribosylformimino-5-aminoimidazole carboxamide ribotide isomerase